MTTKTIRFQFAETENERASGQLSVHGTGEKEASSGFGKRTKRRVLRHRSWEEAVGEKRSVGDNMWRGWRKEWRPGQEASWRRNAWRRQNSGLCEGWGAKLGCRRAPRCAAGRALVDWSIVVIEAKVTVGRTIRALKEAVGAALATKWTGACPSGVNRFTALAKSAAAAAMDAIALEGVLGADEAATHVG